MCRKARTLHTPYMHNAARLLHENDPLLPTPPYSAQGVFPAYSDNTEVNAVDMCPTREILAAADDAKTVRLLRYPVLRGGAKGRAYTAHSSHVMNARFTIGVEPTRLITVGG